jgi:hypothetical protein
MTFDSVANGRAGSNAGHPALVKFSGGNGSEAAVSARRYQRLQGGRTVSLPCDFDAGQV